MKQATLSALKNAILEYGEVRGIVQLNDKINGLFEKYLN